MRKRLGILLLLAAALGVAVFSTDPASVLAVGHFAEARWITPVGVTWDVSVSPDPGPLGPSQVTLEVFFPADTLYCRGTAAAEGFEVDLLLATAHLAPTSVPCIRVDGSAAPTNLLEVSWTQDGIPGLDTSPIGLSRRAIAKALSDIAALGSTANASISFGATP